MGKEQENYSTGSVQAHSQPLAGIVQLACVLTWVVPHAYQSKNQNKAKVSKQAVWLF